MSDAPATHVVIPDTQCKPGVPTDHLSWAGRFINDQFYGKPNVTIIHLGDHWDMPSLSQWDNGKFAMEGRRVAEDIEAGNQGIVLLDAAVANHNANRARNKKEQWRPRKVLLRGNHEDRITRYLELHPNMRGFLDESQLLSPGWEVHPFLKPVFIDGVGLLGLDLGVGRYLRHPPDACHRDVGQLARRVVHRKRGPPRPLDGGERRRHDRHDGDARRGVAVWGVRRSDEADANADAPRTAVACGQR